MRQLQGVNDRCCLYLNLHVCVKFKHFVSLGLWPSFQSWNGPQSARRKTLDINLLDYFLSASHDGIHVIWAHAVNDRDSLQQALYGICNTYSFVLVLHPLAQ